MRVGRASIQRDRLGRLQHVPSAPWDRVVSTAGGGLGAPNNAPYIVVTNDAVLTDERALAVGTGLTTIDTGSNGTLTVALDIDLQEISQVANIRGDVLVTDATPAWVRLGLGGANTILKSNGTDPSWQAGTALTRVDDTNVTLTLGGSATTALVNAASMTLGWTGQLALTRGGTGINAASTTDLFNQLDPLTTRGDLLTRDATNSVRLALGATDEVMTVDAAGLDPDWRKLVRNNVGAATGTTDTFVFGTSPTFTTDITTPLVYGGSGASGTLSLQSTSNATRGQINAVDELRVRTSLATITGVGTVVAAARHTGTLAMNGTLSSFSMILNDGTITNAGADLIFLFYQKGTIDRITGAGTLNPVSFSNQALMRANGVNVTGGTSIGFQHLPRFDQLAGGVLSGMIDNGVSLGMNVIAGTVATRRGVHVNEATGAGALTDQIALDIEALTKGAGLNLSLRSIGTAVQMRHAGPSKIGDNSAPDTTNGNIVEIERTHTLGASIGDGQAAGLVLDPGYTGAFTVTRHTYVKCERPSLAASAVLTDACVLWFDAAAGTHEAVAAHTGAGTPTLGAVSAPVTGEPDAWVKINVNGVVMLMPAWTP